MYKKLHYFLFFVSVLVLITNLNAQVDPGTRKPDSFLDVR